MHHGKISYMIRMRPVLQNRIFEHGAHLASHTYILDHGGAFLITKMHPVPRKYIFYHGREYCMTEGDLVSRRCVLYHGSTAAIMEAHFFACKPTNRMIAKIIEM